MKARFSDCHPDSRRQSHDRVSHGRQAALRGFNVIVPMYGMASNESVPEAYTAWHLVNAARIMAKTTLTRADMISYQ